MRSYLQSLTTAANYKILYIACFDVDQILVFTEISFIDFDINVTGNSSDTRKKAYHNFVLRFDSVKNTLIFQSSVYSDATEKFQKTGFMDALFDGRPVN